MHCRIMPIQKHDKEGSKSGVGNYRPISLTSILYKDMEGVVRDKVVNHMKEDNLYSKDQHGLINGNSMVTELLETLRTLVEASGLWIRICATYLDFQNALDLEPHHQRILKKIRSYRVCEQVYNRIESFLKKGKQKVIIDATESSWTNAESGIPQENVPGPILFF